MLSLEIIGKYNRPVPRYTSYPPADVFSTDYTEEDLVSDIVRSNRVGARALSFYIHIPFCHKLCHYCGCNKELMPSGEADTARYIDALMQELELIDRHLDRDRPTVQIHFGGGSPTSISTDYIEYIVAEITRRHPLSTGAEVAIECHPGHLTEAHWQRLIEMPFTRYSIGVQDFDPRVLSSVHRTPSQIDMREIAEMIHSAGKRFNLDFIYGMPYQTIESFGRTIDQAIGYAPDRVVTFSYAHVPWKFPAQKRLEKLGLPDTKTKKALYDEAATRLKEAGYGAIGLDHFVVPDDPLAIAKRDNNLHRNFQGYCPRDLSGQVYALGASGITQLETSYAQNTKERAHYHTRLAEDRLPTQIGYRLSDAERIARGIISDLMCNYTATPEAYAQEIGRPISTLLDLLPHASEQLEEMQHDGLCDIDETGTITVRPEARLFVRNVASIFDIHYDPSKPRGYSKPI